MAGWFEAGERDQPLEARNGKEMNSPWSLRKEGNLFDNLDLAQRNPFWTSYLQRINFFFKKIFLKFYFKFDLFGFWLHWIFFAVHGSSLVTVSGGYSPVAAASLDAEHGL